MMVSQNVELCGHCFFFFQAEDGIRDLVRSRGLGDVYKRQRQASIGCLARIASRARLTARAIDGTHFRAAR